MLPARRVELSEQNPASRSCPVPTAMVELVVMGFAAPASPSPVLAWLRDTGWAMGESLRSGILQSRAQS